MGLPATVVGAATPLSGVAAPVAGEADDERAGDGRGGDEHHGNGDTHWSHHDLPLRTRHQCVTGF
jgi:hypothetical protein